MSARSEALNILYRIMHDDGYASLIMRESKIKKEEMASVTNIVYGVLRNYTYLEYQWRKYAKRTKLKTALAIDIAVFEMFFTNEKEYAILNEVHNLVNTHDQSFVNAILRKVQANGLQTTEVKEILYSHPKWIIDMWNAHYGEETTLKILEADQKIPKVYGRINPLKITKEQLMNDPSIHFINEESFTMHQSILASDYFKNGQVLIQNPASILPVKYLDVKEDMQVLDICAAPG